MESEKLFFILKIKLKLVLILYKKVKKRFIIVR